MQKELSKKVFDDVIGQDIAISILTSTLRNNRIAPAYLFTGPNGVGRSLVARRFLEGIITGGEYDMRERKRIKELNHPDLIWIEPTFLHQGNLIPESKAKELGFSRRNRPQIRLEQIRELKTFLSRKPLESNLGMVVIEEVDMMNEAAANALLKTLEEPKNSILILICEREERLISTILSRCHKIPFSSLKINLLKEILSQNETTKSFNFSDRLYQKQLLRLSKGSPGALIRNIETLNDFPDEILNHIKELPQKPIDALSLARDITEALDYEQQIWLINWIQLYIWDLYSDSEPIKKLDILRSQLLSFIQPRLAWEVTLLKLIHKEN